MLGGEDDEHWPDALEGPQYARQCSAAGAVVDGVRDQGPAAVACGSRVVLLGIAVAMTHTAFRQAHPPAHDTCLELDSLVPLLIHI